MATVQTVAILRSAAKRTAYGFARRKLERAAKYIIDCMLQREREIEWRMHGVYFFDIIEAQINWSVLGDPSKWPEPNSILLKMEDTAPQS